MRRLLLHLVFMTSVIGVRAQEIPTLNDLSFMSGQWVTEGPWGIMEEFWSEPMGNSMMCAYRCVKEGKVVFYEFIVIEQTEEGLAMKLRHFSPGNLAWEEKNAPYTYPLMFLDTNKARFERPDKKTALTFERVDERNLKVILEREKEGAWVEDVFNYKLTSKQ